MSIAKLNDHYTSNQQRSAPSISIAFVGDGVNDAPVVALADAGIAKGSLGSE